MHIPLIINLNTTTFRLVSTLLEDISVHMNICNEVLLSLSNHKISKQLNSNKGNSSNIKQEKLVEKTCDYLQRNFARPLSIPDICKTMHTNRNTLSQSFRQHLNIGISSWLRKLRMEKAGHLLTTTDMSIQKISESVGYSNQANFATAFKNQFNQSPSLFRNFRR